RKGARGHETRIAVLLATQGFPSRSECARAVWRDTRRSSVSARRTKPRQPSRQVGAHADYSRELLLLMARVLTLTGHSPRRLASQFHLICRRLKEPKHSRDSLSLHFVWDLPHVMARWHSDPQY